MEKLDQYKALFGNTTEGMDYWYILEHYSAKTKM